jgi:hypothetical protein
MFGIQTGVIKPTGTVPEDKKFVSQNPRHYNSSSSLSYILCSDPSFFFLHHISTKCSWSIVHIKTQHIFINMYRVTAVLRQQSLSTI